MNGENYSKLKDLILQKKPAGILLSLKDQTGKYPSVISKEIDCTYTHTLKILSVLERYNLVGFHKQGRIKEVYLTDSGVEVVNSLNELIGKLT